MLKTLDIVHPCYNPGEAWAHNLAFYYNQFISSIPNEVLVSVYLVNDGSSKGINDKDIEFLKSNIPKFNYISLAENLGKGGALRTAISQTQGDLVIYTDADYPYQISNMLEIFEILKSGEIDVVVGIRDEQYYDNLPFRRKIFSLGLKFMNYVFFPALPVKDTQSGLKGFNKRGKELFLKTKIYSFLFDMEFLVLISKSKEIRFKWIYVHLREGITFSSIRITSVVQEMIHFMTILLRRVLILK